MALNQSTVCMDQKQGEGGGVHQLGLVANWGRFVVGGMQARGTYHTAFEDHKS